ncbi:DUF4260 family protein [Shimazuella alba]|uniref:DUF4260 family protein n=1 Tax=Shimazuella alba TaxID=2690964 RepID=A0A6I4VWF8_9BACL|nr:DUF4260 family protein [Shimazuella alba]
MNGHFFICFFFRHFIITLLINLKIGAQVYNLFHTYTLSLFLLLSGIVINNNRCLMITLTCPHI